MSYVKEDYVLGNKKIVVGDNLHDLVLENLGKIYIRYGNSYKDFSELLKAAGKAASSKNFIIETDGLKDPSEYGNGVLVYDVKAGILYLSYNGELLELVENIGTNDSKYVRKTGDKMTGQLVINTREAPLVVQSSEMVKNFNANLLEGHDADEFALKARNEKITGNWTFAGENEFQKENTFQDTTYFNDTAVFNRTGDGAAIRVGTGDVITDGSIGSSQFASGMTGYGWRLDADTNTLTIDNLIVRGILQVFELVVNKISATNGSFWVTDSFEIEKVHDLRFLNLHDQDLNLFSLNVDTYYIPYIYDTTHVFDISASRQEIEEVSKETNFYQIQLNDSEYPLATRSIKQPRVGVVYDKFDFLFQIIDLPRFIATFSKGRMTVEDYYFGFMDNLYYDEVGRLRQRPTGNEPFICDVDFFAMWSEGSDHEIEFSCSEEHVEKALTQYDVRNTLIAKGEDGIDITQMANREVMLELAAKGIIQFTFLYQKDTKRINDYITLAAEGSDQEVLITPMDDLFDKQIYSVVSASDVHIDNETGQYTYDDPNNLCRINLYYKYFGEHANKQFVGDDEPFMPNLYIVEAKNEQYPVFKPGDIIKCQKFTGTAVKQYNAIVLSLIGSYGFLIELQNHNVLSAKTSFSYDANGVLTDSSYEIDTALYQRSGKLTQEVRKTSTVDEDTSSENLSESDEWKQYASEQELVADSINKEQKPSEEVDTETREVVETQTLASPEKGDALVRVGSIFFGDRQRSMLLTSSEDNSPYQDIIVNVNRPDYGVIYFTPRYKTFDAYFKLNGQTRKATFYFQNSTFSHIMTIGEAYFKQIPWDEIIDEEAKLEMVSYENWAANYLEFYEKYEPYTAKKEISLDQAGDSENDYSGISKIVNVALTYQPNWDTPIYYRENAEGEQERIKVIMPDGGENNEYFVSSNVNATVISTYKANNPESVTHYDKKTHDYVLLSIGQTA